MRNAINTARRLLALAATDSPTIAREHLTTAEAAKELEYVSRNAKSVFKKFVTKYWPELVATRANGLSDYAIFDAQGWPAEFVDELKSRHKSMKSMAAIRRIRVKRNSDTSAAI